MGVGLGLKKLTAESLSTALKTITSDQAMRARAIEVGNRIRSEDGVRAAINYIYRDMDYSLEHIKHLANLHRK
jgi:sterol 3beta-glucosyltransferase